MADKITNMKNSDSAANDRYSRQILFSPIGKAGQEEIARKHVLIIGVGALGTSNAEILLRSGVGEMTIVDRDYIEFSNLQRQQLFTEQNAIDRTPKTVAAKERLLKIRSSATIHAHIMDVNPETIDSLTENVDLIIDATDNFETRMIINDISQKKGIPWIYGACVASYGISMTIIPGETPCLHCLMETVPSAGAATCDTAGIIAPAVQMTVAHQSAEALKILSGNLNALRRKLISFDLWNNEYAQVGVSKARKEDCPSCGSHPSYPFLQWENQTKTAVLCGRNTVQIRPGTNHPPNLENFKEQIERLGIPYEANPFLISFTVDSFRIVLFKDGRALIHGTKDISKAKTLYHRFIG
ncbi:thiazole biosynthesis adenylyltransferase ThiF [Aciduricibacillus chroicocephali]|uniref:Thiazole biosynthesis adenylyltransferase ThiF n=1 Tax=Aciduricibacillus chroicocephali TaxID=3054939 RepID=A0ABY9KSX6_9BACI|nr:thiazole biosynthesis adenylyltransferase ThiF [Bacillaceae bacterium 44XB]